MKTILIISIILLLLPNVGYLICLYLLTFVNGIFRPQKSKEEKSNLFPQITIIVVAKNEEKIIEKKIANIQNLEYPIPIKTIVVSDGSTDKTPEIVRRIDNVDLIDLKVSMGKTYGQNLGIKQSSGEIIVFTDANSILDSKALLNLIKPFKNKNVGCVAGHLVYIPENTPTGSEQGESLFVTLDSLIREAESSLGFQTGVDGGLYAIRSKLYQELPSDIISDFVTPLNILLAGYMIKYTKEAIYREKPPSKSSILVLKRRRRIVARTIRGMVWFLQSCRGSIWRKIIIALAVFVRKILRWLTLIPFSMFLISLGFLTLENPFYSSLAFLIYILLAISVFSIFMEKKTKLPKIISISGYIIIMLVAGILGLLDAITGKKYTTWSPRAD